MKRLCCVFQILTTVTVFVGVGLRAMDATAAGGGPAFQFPEGITVEAGGTLVVADRDRRAVVRVELGSGDRTIVSDASTGSGPAFQFPEGIAVEAGGTLVVADRDRRAVVRVEPGSGDRTLVSGFPPAGCILTVHLDQFRVRPGDRLGVKIFIQHNQPHPVQGPFILWVADHRGMPLMGKISPPVTLHHGDTIRHQRMVTIPAHMSPGQYYLVVSVPSMQQGVASSRQTFWVVKERKPRSIPSRLPGEARE
jgi:hypothetical protein